MCPVVFNDNSTFRAFSITMVSLLAKKMTALSAYNRILHRE